VTEKANWLQAPLVHQWGEPEMSALAAAESARRAAGLPVDDFITAHPYDHGFRFNENLLAQIVARATQRSVRYAADPLGQLAAREAVVQFHQAESAGHSQLVSPANVLLTPGTSIAYFYLFRLLAGTHGEVLCPAPTYPLFDDLARIAGLQVRRYHLHRTLTAEGLCRWVVDPGELAFQIRPQTCAIVLVSPHNPTGTIINAAEMDSIAEVANRAAVPLIMDEVFRNYSRTAGAPVPRPSEHGSRLSFTLNGLSKSHYLPGMKAGWIIAEGEKTAVSPMMHALEYMSDSFLPVQEITQAALPELLGPEAMAEARQLQTLQRERLSARLANAGEWPVAVPEAGPYVCIPLEQILAGDPGSAHTHSDEQVSLGLLENYGAHFHPGSFYQFPDPWLVATAFNQADWPPLDNLQQ
jgi:aspartate/methionine/tyrosine aminotransferase